MAGGATSAPSFRRRCCDLACDLDLVAPSDGNISNLLEPKSHRLGVLAPSLHPKVVHLLKSLARRGVTFWPTRNVLMRRPRRFSVTEYF